MFTENVWRQGPFLVPTGKQHHFNPMNEISKLLVLASTLLAPHLFGQTYSVLHNFTNSPDGRFPDAGLVLSGDTLYGTTYSGGSSSNGIVFKINTDGSGFAVLHNFSALVQHTNSDGANPQCKLVLASNMLYGTTKNGGYVYTGCAYGGGGTVFAVDTNGVSFTPITYIPLDNAYPETGLVLNSNTLYGTTYGAEADDGMVFAVNTDGTGFTNLSGTTSQGTVPGGLWPGGTLLLASNTLYGTSCSGLSGGVGYLFAINMDGTGFTNVFQFSYGIGAGPMCDLVLSSNTLYGTCGGGGPGGGGGTVFKVNTDGTGFAVLKSYADSFSAIDGSCPVAGLVLSGSTLYGTTKWGGSGGFGTVFRIGTDGSGYAVLVDFTGTHGANPGDNPVADLVLSGNTLYGTTAGGGTAGCGVVFSLTLPPPSLQVTNAGNLPIVFWLDDGQSHTLQTATDLAAGNWSYIPSLNWTNNSGGTVTIGYQVPDTSSSPAAFFRLR
jgi:uncharacterized repeat protein (TIGR03803 family)